MDQTFQLKLEEFKKAIDTLNEAIAVEKSTLVRDSVIKRFEYTFELAWKTAKVLLNDKFGVKVTAPKECFRELRNKVALSDQDVEDLLEMTDDRNEVIHTYKEAFANELYEKIVSQYAPLLQKVYKMIGSE